MIVNKRSQDFQARPIDFAESNRIVGIEILDASRNLNLERLLP
jgi:hypothetical protein